MIKEAAATLFCYTNGSALPCHSLSRTLQYTSMLKAALVAVVMVAAVVPTWAMWPSTSYYIDYVVAKNCFGEKAALEMERIGMEVGKACWMKEWEESFGMADGNSGRNKRNVLKMPSPASTSLLVCNLRSLNVLTPKYEMNYPLVDAWISANVTDADVRERLLRLSKECQPRPMPLAPLAPLQAMEGADNVVKGVRNFHIYMECMNAGGTDICMHKEMERVKSKWDGINYP